VPAAKRTVSYRLLGLGRSIISTIAMDQIFFALQCKASAGTRKKKTITIRTFAKTASSWSAECKVDRLVLKAMPDESPKAQISDGKAAFFLATR
jgi:hypothetical protein